MYMKIGVSFVKCNRGKKRARRGYIKLLVVLLMNWCDKSYE